MSAVLGINAYHGDAAACLLRDGRLVAAAEEERFRRVKHWAGFPGRSISYCLAEAGITLAEVDHVAINQDSRSNLGRKLAYVLSRRPDLAMLRDRLRNKRARAGVAETLERTLGTLFRGEVHHVEHHLCHLASAYHVSPFTEAVAVSVDGFGDFASACWGWGKGAEVTLDQRVYFPHSLGIFYQAMTQYLGFPNYGDEYKLMGLAPYGEPRYAEALRRIVRLRDGGQFELDLDYFRHHREKLDYQWSDGEPKFAPLFSAALEERFGAARKAQEDLAARHRDLARSTQTVYEEAFFHVLRAAHAAQPSDNLALAGGCAMNSVANGKVYGNTPFRRMYVQPAAGDAGGAIGAALVVWRKLDRRGRPFRMNHAYWGPAFDEAEIGRVIDGARAALAAGGCVVERVEDEESLCSRVAAALAAGRVVGWFQGRMEWGPRALGNRSILCDPRREDARSLLNAKIKRRESFRPFAPSILRESVAEWFEVEDDVPFMTQVYPIRPAKRALVPAVAHVDGSGRLQTVTQDANPRYYRLIARFRALTGVPMVLNTSFNENEPVVCRPEEALDCFLRTSMDMLAMGYWIVRRASGAGDDSS